MIKNVDCMQVGDVDCIDERLEALAHVECIHVDDGDCSCILDVDLRC